MKKIFAFSVWCLIALFAFSAQATTLIPMNLQQLTRAAHTIIKGTITDIHSVQEEHQIVSYITLADVQCLKGTANADQTFVFSQVASSHPEYKLGKTYLLFLPNHTHNNVTPIGGMQGVFEIQNNEVRDLKTRQKRLSKNLALNDATKQNLVLNNLSETSTDTSFATLALSIQTILADQN